MNNEAINNVRKDVFEFPFLFMNKEDLKSVNFSSLEVWFDEAKRKERQEKLQKALVLGNIYKTHVQLMMVNSSHQHIKTTATVWAVTEKYVTLKGGVVIPVGSIMDIVF